MGINQITAAAEQANEYGLTPTQCAHLLDGILQGEPDGSYFFAWGKKQKNAK